MNEVVASPVLEEPPIIGEAGEGFDVFSSSIGGSANEDFSTRIDSEATTAGADDFDLVAVANGEETLDTTINNSDNSKETSNSVDPAMCRNFGTIACVGCIFAQDCQRRQAEMMASNKKDQPEQLSTLEKLLQEDEDEEPGRIVWAQPTPDDTSREQPPAAEEDSSSTPEPESEPEPRPEFKPEEQPLADTQSPLWPSNKQREPSEAALSQAAESRSSESLNHEVDESHGDDEEKSTTAHIANVVKKTTSSDDGSANLEANSNSTAKASKEPHAQIDSDNTNEHIKQDELPLAADRAADDSDKLINQQTVTVRRATQTAQRSNKHADQEVSSAVNITEQISSANTHQAIEIPKPEDTGSTVATAHSQKEPAIKKVSSTPIDANDTLADSGTSTAVDRVVNRQERPSPKSKSISAENNNLLKKTTPKILQLGLIVIHQQISKSQPRCL